VYTQHQTELERWGWPEQQLPLGGSKPPADRQLPAADPTQCDLAAYRHRKAFFNVRALLVQNQQKELMRKVGNSSNRSTSRWWWVEAA
jgi:hypothetical protein